MFQFELNKDWEWTDDERKAFQDKHQELSILLDYPPFSINREKREDFRQGILSENERIRNTGEISRPFSTIEVKFQDDLEEARLYQKRYNSPKKAQDAALEMNNMTADDEGVLELWQ